MEELDAITKQLTLAIAPANLNSPSMLPAESETLGGSHYQHLFNASDGKKKGKRSTDNDNDDQGKTPRSSRHPFIDRAPGCSLSTSDPSALIKQISPFPQVKRDGVPGRNLCLKFTLKGCAGCTPMRGRSKCGLFHLYQSFQTGSIPPPVHPSLRMGV